ncbi:hypothetical protein BDB01DRAFT_837773 [Pilobolus umbonatus]|nr:hypothetical protein BDB01DRAFT_837773 [Pilobolus umbonatus]
MPIPYFLAPPRYMILKYMGNMESWLSECLYRNQKYGEKWTKSIKIWKCGFSWTWDIWNSWRNMGKGTNFTEEALQQYHFRFGDRLQGDSKSDGIHNLVYNTQSIGIISRTHIFHWSCHQIMRTIQSVTSDSDAPQYISRLSSYSCPRTAY